jgi:UDP-N-acetylglucosamine--N-acetylmuramyl-(pentapeptide) pyrophosphoryl-undecaprenol N-acetylglucosamine transferase
MMLPERPAELCHVVFAGGGTGGHLFPGLAVASQLRTLNPAIRITLATGNKPLERDQAANAGLEQLRLPSHPWPRGPRGAWRFMADNLTGYRSARRFLRKSNVAAVVGLGGYASVPMAWAAAAAGVPLVLLEQNAVPGRVTRWLAPRASLLCVAFEEAREQVKCGGPVRLTGNPIRRGFCVSATPERRADSATRQLLVLGGSGGSRTLNEQLPRALYRLGEHMAGWRVIHQTGPRDVEATRHLYQKLGIAADVVAFVNRLAPVLHQTDLVVCRAGGTTLAELSTVGLPALLIPYPHAADDHQRRNADVFAAAGAARIVDQREVKGRLDDALAVELADLLLNPSRLKQMATAMRRCAHPNAAWHVATMILDLAHPTRLRRAG